MGRLKGCINKNCIANQKKHTFKEADDYCSKCGNKLYYVCKDCYTQLPDDAAKYCERCIAKKQDRIDHLKDNGLKIAGVVAPLGIAGVSKWKEVIKFLSKLK